MEKPLKILMLEDSSTDAKIIQHTLIKQMPHCEFKLVMTETEYCNALDSFHPDLILSDNTLPQFNATEALKIFHQRSLQIPFILVTGTVSEEFAAGIIKLGADDYILKDRLTRLPGAIEAVLQKKKTEADVRHSEEVRKHIINASLDAIICIDITGAITVWNPQAEKLFGWKEHEILGKKLAETIIPEHHRAIHTNGYEQYLTAEDSTVVNRARETTAVDSKGNEFPVELGIVSIRQKEGDFFCVFIRDITERKKAEETKRDLEKLILDQSIQEQKKISRAIIKAQEEEKNHIGQELHDNISQILAGAKIFLSIAAKKKKELKQLLRYPMELIDSSIEEIRLLSYKQVTPLKNINLEEMLRKLIDSLSHGIKPQISLNYSVPGAFLFDELKLNMYRIVQEQLNNILKHADANNVDVTIKAEERNICIAVTDDGKGFTTTDERKGIGISNMINRVESYNGKLEIISSPGKGCILSVIIPL